MRITFLINRDLCALLALNYLLPSLCENQRDHQIYVFYTDKHPSDDRPTPLQQLAKFEHDTLLDLENERPESARSNKLGGLLALSQLQTFTEEDIVCLNSVNNADFEKLKQSQPDLIVSIRHMTILREAVIAMPKLGVINLHSGLLPAYQGVMSSFRAMCNQEPVLGSTLHFVEDRKIDSGAIIAHAQTPTRFDKSYLWNALNLYRGGCQLIHDAIISVASNKALNSTTQRGSSRYFSYPDQQELIEFENQRLKLFELDDLSYFKTNTH